MKIGQPITIDEGATTIGYVAEVEKTGSGFKAYVITDIKLPKNPTKQDFDKVNQVTMLYEGSTASFESVEKGWDTFLDWVINDLPMAARVTVPDWVPTRGTVQLRKAAEFTNDSMEKYRHAYFDFYGHSLGSMNTQYGVTSVNNEHLDRISGVYLYNGPNTYRVLSSEQRLKEKILHNRIYNYIDPLDIVGLGYGGCNDGGMFMKIKQVLTSLFILIGMMSLLGGCSMTKETLTKEQQDNVVKWLVRKYEFDSIEFLDFSRDSKTGSYHIHFLINNNLESGLTISDIKKFDSPVARVTLGPISKFSDIEKPASNDEEINIENIRIAYLGE
ncbi:DUF2974 domain-containing protein [Streptococcus ruminantium]|uniref:DUF2974 domain-containing protein n=1 Tax=Streptococcus ruminantium TaxID=1917441 RepID=UPI0012DFA78F|nr:DUF2974 domain-containing protein [Streptococcus ruminantium]